MEIRTVADFLEAKRKRKQITVLTCYDFWSASILAETPVDCLLVGDSAAMVVHGHATTIPATIEMLSVHVESVRRGAPEKFVVADMPFLSTRMGLPDAVRVAGCLVRAGAQAVKVEGVEGHLEIIGHLVESGIPVMGHLGLTPQSVHRLGGYRVQGRTEEQAEAVSRQAGQLAAAGCFAVVLECVPAGLSSRLTRDLSVPTIGIGAGPDCDGQVLVLQDLLGLSATAKPRFVREYLDGKRLVREAVCRFCSDVEEGSFPSETESYR